MAHYLLNTLNGDAADGSALRELAAGRLRVRLWGVSAGDPHREALAPGDLAVVYLGAPARVFVGRAALASAVHQWSASEASAYPGDAPEGVSLADVEEWDSPVPMTTVLSRIPPSEAARADFHWGVVRITADEYGTTLAVAAGS